MRAVVIINPVSGPRRRPLDACVSLAREVLERHGAHVTVRVTGARGDARTFSEQARAEGADVVIAWGGDGTINEVGSGVARSGVALGIVPGGSGNGLARELGIPLQWEPALTAIARGARRRIDVGQLDGALFFNVAGVGLDAVIARCIARPDAQRGLAGYARLTFRELPRFRPERYAIECDGEIQDGPVLFAALANSRQYGNGAQIAPAARLDDGVLDLVVVQPQSLWRIARRLPDLFRGRLRSGPGITMRRMTRATIRGDGPIAYHVDGEPGVGGAALSVRVLPGALTVVVP